MPRSNARIFCCAVCALFIADHVLAQYRLRLLGHANKLTMAVLLFHGSNSVGDDHDLLASMALHVCR